MPVRLGKKKYKSFKGAQRAIAKKKGISMKRAAAYVASVERAMGRNPRTGRRLRKRKR
jgi:hypothetical protein